MGFFLSRYALFLPLGILLHYRYACANNLEPLTILKAICLHMVSYMFLRIVVNLALYALSEREAAKLIFVPNSLYPMFFPFNTLLFFEGSVP